MLKGLQCIIVRFQTGVDILKFSRERERSERESFTFACLRIIKHGDQKESGLFYDIYSNKLCLSSISNINVLFPLRLLLVL